MADNDNEGGGNVVEFPELWRRPDFQVTDNSIAECYAHRHGRDFCYTRTRKTWRRYDGTRWRDDALLDLSESMRQMLNHEIAPYIKRLYDREKLASTKMLGSVERHLRSMRRTDEELFDRDPWLLNCPSGTVDLRDIAAGLKKHDRGQYLTKMAGADPIGSCEQWKAFLGWMTCGDTELASYLQRLAGYALVGEATEQMFAFLHGEGGNGKSVYLQTLLHVMGDYAVSVGSEIFVQQRFEQHPEALMRLRGARLVVATEIAANAKWNMERLQALTGGERVVARGMRENSIEFDFGGTILIAGNNKPALTQVNDAIRRRLFLVPFNARVAESDVDRMMATTLRAEAGGILLWMLEGCDAWQRHGLDPPKAVKAATADYLETEDHIREWIAECCTLDRLAAQEKQTEALNNLYITTISRLFSSWSEWAARNQVAAISKNYLSERLAKMAFDDERNCAEAPRPMWQLKRDLVKRLVVKGRVFRGIRVNLPDPSGEEP